MPRNTILLISTQSTYSNELKSQLETEGLHVKQVDNGQQALKLLENENPSIILLNCDDHGMIDLTMCQKVLRSYSGLFILLSDIGNNHFQIFALSLGADASFPKSTSLKVIAANVKSLLRRFTTTKEVRQLTFGTLSVDPDRRDAFVDKAAAHLSTMEFDLLWFLVQHSGNVVSRDDIHKRIYNAEYNGYDRSIDLYISRIRQKIGDPPDSPNYLKTVRGVGYQFIGLHGS